MHFNCLHSNGCQVNNMNNGFSNSAQYSNLARCLGILFLNISSIKPGKSDVKTYTAQSRIISLPGKNTQLEKKHITDSACGYAERNKSLNEDSWVFLAWLACGIFFIYLKTLFQARSIIEIMIAFRQDVFMLHFWSASSVVYTFLTHSQQKACCE